MRRRLTPPILLFSVAAALLSAPAARADDLDRGVALGLFSEDPGWSYRPLLDEIAGTGADTVELVVPWYLTDVRASDVHDHPRLTPPLATVERTVREAHAAGLRVLLFPILRLEQQASPDEWRGTLRPSPAARHLLFASYQRRLTELAQLAERTHAEWLSVGSELSTLDTDTHRAAWVPLVAAVRKAFHGRLTYSGNWDHFEHVALYDLVDAAGLCAYWKLAEESPPHDRDGDAQLTKRWRELREDLARFSARVGKPVVLTEVGYLSQRGAVAWPWSEGATEPVDLDEQRRAYAAFREAWVTDGKTPSFLRGVYFWNWYGWGGDTSGGYTPRHKPAENELRRFFRALPEEAPAN